MFKSNLLKEIPSFLNNEHELKQNNPEPKIESPIDALKNVTHHYTLTHLRHKLRAAELLLSQQTNQKTLIYCSRKRDKILLDRFLMKAGHEITLLDNFGQNVHQIVETLKERPNFVLISSDGINLTPLKDMVINVIHFDMPPRPVDYLTRLMTLCIGAQNQAQPKQSYMIATAREYAVLQLLQNNYKFPLKDMNFPELGGDIMAHEADLSYAEQRSEQPAEQHIDCYEYGNRIRLETSSDNQTSSQRGFENNPPAFFKLK